LIWSSALVCAAFIKPDLLFAITYAAILAYVLTFLHQMFQNNMQEEKTERRNIFQIAFTTSLLLFGLSSVDVSDVSDDSLFYSCSAEYRYQIAEYYDETRDFKVPAEAVQKDSEGYYYLAEEEVFSESNEIVIEEDAAIDEAEASAVDNNEGIVVEASKRFAKTRLERIQTEETQELKSCEIESKELVTQLENNRERPFELSQVVENSVVESQSAKIDFSLWAYFLFLCLWLFGQLFWMQNSGNQWLSDTADFVIEKFKTLITHRFGA